MRDKRILFILPSTSVGGAETQVLILANSMSADNDVTILCFHSAEDYVINERIKGTGIKIRVIQSHGLFGRGTWYYRFIILFLYLATHRYSIIMPYLDEMNFMVGLIKKVLNYLTIVWNQRDAGLARFAYPKLAKYSVRNYNAFISNSEEGAVFLREKFGVSERLISIIPNGISIKSDKSRNEWRSQNGFNDTDYLVCMLANLQENKDHITLLKSWKQIEKKINNCRLLLVGYKGSTYDIINQFIDDNKMASVVIYGETKEPANLLNAMDVSVLSSKSEGLSNTMLETLCIGTPFVGTKIQGITQVLGEDYPYLFEYTDYNELTRILMDIYNDSNKADSISKEYKTKINYEYSVNALHYRTTSFLDVVLNRRNLPRMKTVF